MSVVEMKADVCLRSAKVRLGPITDIDCWDRCGDKRTLDYPALRNGLRGSKNGAGDSDLTIFLPKLHVVDQLLRAFLALQSTAARYFVRECPAIRLSLRSKTGFRCPCLARAFGDRSVRWRNRCGFATRAGVGMFEGKNLKTGKDQNCQRDLHRSAPSSNRQSFARLIYDQQQPKMRRKQGE